MGRLASRFAAGVLLVFNIVAAISYAALRAIAVKEHVSVGNDALVLAICRPGRIALAARLERRFVPRAR